MHHLFLLKASKWLCAWSIGWLSLNTLPSDTPNIWTCYTSTTGSYDASKSTNLALEPSSSTGSFNCGRVPWTPSFSKTGLESNSWIAYRGVRLLVSASSDGSFSPSFPRRFRPWRIQTPIPKIAKVAPNPTPTPVPVLAPVEKLGDFSSATWVVAFKGCCRCHNCWSGGWNKRRNRGRNRVSGLPTKLNTICVPTINARYDKAGSGFCSTDCVCVLICPVHVNRSTEIASLDNGPEFVYTTSSCSKCPATWSIVSCQHFPANLAFSYRCLLVNRATCPYSLPGACIISGHRPTAKTNDFGRIVCHWRPARWEAFLGICRT